MIGGALHSYDGRLYLLCTSAQDASWGVHQFGKQPLPQQVPCTRTAASLTCRILERGVVAQGSTLGHGQETGLVGRVLQRAAQLLEDLALRRKGVACSHQGSVCSHQGQSATLHAFAERQSLSPALTHEQLYFTQAQAVHGSHLGESL